MNDSIQVPVGVRPRTKQNETRKHIRGSSLLLIGRIASLGLNFGVQILIVRFLSKSDYGAFAYALSLVSLGSSVAVFGLDKTISRFVPIYQEHGDYNKLFGTIIMMVGTIISIGLAIVLLVYGLQGLMLQSLVNDKRAIVLLLILIFLAPIQALDSLLLSMFAIFASPSAIFFRKHVLGPGLKLGVVVLLIWAHSNVHFLASGYLVAGIVGISIYIIVLLRLMQKQGIFKHFNFRTLKMPGREIFSFSIPLLSSDLVFLLRSSFIIILLGYFQNTTEVANFRAVLPVAKLNLIVLQNFTFLFTPLAARLFARNDREEISNLYWQSAIWITVISFPIFVVSFSLAQPLTLLLFGSRYSQSATILALLSLGYYFNAALGFNALTLRVYGKVRYLFIIDICAAAFSIITSLLLIPRYGALGAAMSVCATLIIHNIFNHIGLRFGTNVKLFQWHYFRAYISIILGALGLLLIQWALSPSFYSGLAISAIVALFIAGFNRKLLNIEQIFPELLRIPLMRQLLANN